MAILNQLPVRLVVKKFHRETCLHLQFFQGNKCILQWWPKTGTWLHCSGDRGKSKDVKEVVSLVS